MLWRNAGEDTPRASSGAAVFDAGSHVRSVCIKTHAPVQPVMTVPFFLPMHRLLLFALLAAGLVGCDSTGTEPCPDAASCPDPGGPVVIDGVNLTALFAAPTAAERDTVAARLGRTGGTAAPHTESVVATELGTDGDATRYVRLDLRIADGQAVAFGLARIPSRAIGNGEKLPVLFLLPDDGDTSESAFLTGLYAADLDKTTVQIVLAARGGTLTARGTGPPRPGDVPVAYRSAVPADPYRADVLDLLAATDHLALVPRADAQRVGVLGIGRGGAVGLLAAERRPGRFRALVPLGAPTSLFDLTFQTAARDALLGRPASRLPSAEALLAPVRALRAGQIAPEEARLRLLELSAIALAGRLPATLAFHADPDDVVPTAHLDALLAEGQGTFEEPRRFVRVPEGRHDDLLSALEVTGPIATFLGQRFQL